MYRIPSQIEDCLHYQQTGQLCSTFCMSYPCIADKAVGDLLVKEDVILHAYDLFKTIQKLENHRNFIEDSYWRNNLGFDFSTDELDVTKRVLSCIMEAACKHMEKPDPPVVNSLLPEGLYVITARNIDEFQYDGTTGLIASALAKPVHLLEKFAENEILLDKIEEKEILLEPIQEPIQEEFEEEVQEPIREPIQEEEVQEPIREPIQEEEVKEPIRELPKIVEEVADEKTMSDDFKKVKPKNKNARPLEFIRKGYWKSPCPTGKKCRSSACTMTHSCIFGKKCTNRRCKLLHPKDKDYVYLGCVNGDGCFNEKCKYVHMPFGTTMYAEDG